MSNDDQELPGKGSSLIADIFSNGIERLTKLKNADYNINANKPSYTTTTTACATLLSPKLRKQAPATLRTLKV
jgi:hypothetical protein